MTFCYQIHAIFIYQVKTEWDRLKNHIRYILENNLKTTYLNIWKKNLYQLHHLRRVQKHTAHI